MLLKSMISPFPSYILTNAISCYQNLSLSVRKYSRKCVDEGFRFVEVDDCFTNSIS